MTLLCFVKILVWFISFIGLLKIHGEYLQIYTTMNFRMIMFLEKIIVILIN